MTIPLPQGPLTCSRCGAIDQPKLTAGTGPHVYRANCAHCHAFLRWVSTRSHEERVHRREQFRQAAVGSKPPTAPQLAYLAALGDSGPPPANRAEASQRIDRLKQKKGVA